MNYSQCLMCLFVFGRSCKKTNKVINDDIYNNKIKCELFKSITESTIDVDDSCCSEEKRYDEVKVRYE